MTISPNRSAIFHGTDPVAGALRVSFHPAAMTHAERVDQSGRRSAALDLEALYPALFPAVEPTPKTWLLRRLIPQH